LELDFEVTDKPLSDIPNDVESFHGENAAVHFPPAQPIMPGVMQPKSIAEYVNPAEDPHDEAFEGDDGMFDLEKAEYEAQELAQPHMLNGFLPEDPCCYPQDVQEAKAEAQEDLAAQDLIEHPSHYAKADIPSGIECWDWYELAMTEEEFIGHMKGNVLKYVFRAGRKEDGAQDLEKAGAYLKRWLSYLDGDRTVHMKGKKNDG
jgi:hypothetical protein